MVCLLFQKRINYLLHKKRIVTMDYATFYFEWLGVDKNHFRILSLLAPTGEYTGNLSDMCRSLNISAQTTNRNKLKSSIKELSECGYITSSLSGRTYTLKANAKETVIQIPAEWLNQIMNHSYTTENVSWQVVLKVLLWLCINKEPIVKREMIAEDINCGVDTITSALNVLERDYNAIIREFVTIQTFNGEYRRIGLELTPIAWWE